MTSIIISHKLNEISYVADKITVIRDGSTIETMDKEVDDFSENRIIRGMVGRELSNRFRPEKCQDRRDLYGSRSLDRSSSDDTGKGKWLTTYPFMYAAAKWSASPIDGSRTYRTCDESFGHSYGTGHQRND